MKLPVASVEAPVWPVCMCVYVLAGVHPASSVLPRIQHNTDWMHGWMGDRLWVTNLS